MSVLLSVFFLFIIIFTVVAFGHQATTGNIEKIQFQRNRKQQLRIEYSELKKTVADLKGDELSLRRRLEGEDGLWAGVQPAGGGDEETGAPTRKKLRSVPTSLIEILLAEKVLTPENLQKAENYKRQSKSPYAIDEILSLLGYVSPEVIQQVKRRHPNIS